MSEPQAGPPETLAKDVLQLVYTMQEMNHYIHESYNPNQVQDQPVLGWEAEEGMYYTVVMVPTLSTITMIPYQLLLCLYQLRVWPFADGNRGLRSGMQALVMACFGFGVYG